MGPGYFVIAILGCADGGAACTPVATLPTHYSTASECSVATAAALESHNDFDFPTLLAQCRAQSASVSKSSEASQEVALAQRG